MNDCRKVNSWFATVVRNAIRGLLATLAIAAVSGIASAQEKKDEVRFRLVPIPQFVDCLRANRYEEPKARATVIRGKQNDTLILDLDGIRPDLVLSIFSLERSNLRADSTRDPNFKGFGLSWYQSEVETGRRSDDGHARIKTVLLDETFGFDNDVNLPPTNAFHLGFWFDDPQDAVACGFDPTKPSVFNGEHKAGPLAMITVPDVETNLGPLCTEPNKSTTPATCGEQAEMVVH